MTTLARRLILLAIGLLSGLCAWPVAELILFLQAGFPSYLVFSAFLGAVTGALMGAFFGTAEGITSRVKSRIPAGVLLGAIVGCVGGGLGLLAGQAVLWLIGTLAMQSYANFQRVVLPFSHAIGWAVLGVFVGAGEGVRAGSLKKIGIGILGGVAGGLLGGFVLEYGRLLLSHVGISRLLGFAVLGLAIGGFYGLIERGMSFGIFRILTGALKGKEFLLNQRRMRLGRSPRNEIALPSYEDLADRQAQVRIRKGEVVLVNLEPRLPILVNEQKIAESTVPRGGESTGNRGAERRLKFGDVIRIGSARIFYKYE
ncbi:MAG: FHA domain-containing protein [Spirochaetia bacterium]